jgi:hypothetical protein
MYLPVGAEFGNPGVLHESGVTYQLDSVSRWSPSSGHQAMPKCYRSVPRSRQLCQYKVRVGRKLLRAQGAQPARSVGFGALPVSLTG